MLNLFALKIKVRSLMAESQIIRHQVSKLGGKNWSYLASPLQEYRRVSLRAEARDTHIAYGFLKGRSYIEIESTVKRPADWDNIARMVKKYGNARLVDKLEDWMYGTIPTINEAA